MKIPLFDIDDTLIIGGSQAYKAGFARAFSEVYHLPNASQADIDPVGKIDNQIILEIAQVHGVAHQEARAILPEAVKTIVTYHQAHEIDLRHQVAAGAIDLLQTLKALSLPLGLLTGNIQASALIKLKAAGIDQYFTFGAFGDQAFKRVDLIDIAVKRYNALNHQQKIKTDFVIVGDSALDVKCAQDGHIKVIAVASGKFTQTDLRNAGADLVVKSLSEKTKITEFLKLS